MNNPPRDLLDADELLAEPLTPASRTKRFLNMMIDTVFYYVFIFVFLGFISFVVAIISPEAGDSINNSFSQPAQNSSFNLLINLSGIVLVLIYYVVFEYWLGKTPGKMITKTRVVNKEGEKPTFTAVLWRSLARLIPFEAFLYLREAPIGIHDRLSGTMVINDRPRWSFDQSLQHMTDETI